VLQKLFRGRLDEAREEKKRCAKWNVKFGLSCANVTSEFAHTPLSHTLVRAVARACQRDALSSCIVVGASRITSTAAVPRCRGTAASPRRSPPVSRPPAAVGVFAPDPLSRRPQGTSGPHTSSPHPLESALTSAQGGQERGWPRQPLRRALRQISRAQQRPAGVAEERWQRRQRPGDACGVATAPRILARWSKESALGAGPRTGARCACARRPTIQLEPNTMEPGRGDRRRGSRRRQQRTGRRRRRRRRGRRRGRWQQQLAHRAVGDRFPSDRRKRNEAPRRWSSERPPLRSALNGL
jgi:hypothetical protein